MPYSYNVIVNGRSLRVDSETPLSKDQQQQYATQAQNPIQLKEPLPPSMSASQTTGSAADFARGAAAGATTVPFTDASAAEEFYSPESVKAERRTDAGQWGRMTGGLIQGAATEGFGMVGNALRAAKATRSLRELQQAEAANRATMAAAQRAEGIRSTMAGAVGRSFEAPKQPEIDMTSTPFRRARPWEQGGTFERQPFVLRPGLEAREVGGSTISPEEDLGPRMKPPPEPEAAAQQTTVPPGPDPFANMPIRQSSTLSRIARSVSPGTVRAGVGATIGALQPSDPNDPASKVTQAGVRALAGAGLGWLIGTVYARDVSESLMSGKGLLRHIPTGLLGWALAQHGGGYLEALMGAAGMETVGIPMLRNPLVRGAVTAAGAQAATRVADPLIEEKMQ